MNPANRIQPLSPGNIFAGKFQLEQMFASGGMGSVWRAMDTQRGARVAVKVMAASMTQYADFVIRFEREALAAAQLHTPHVVKIYEHGVHEQLPYIAMELLDGEDLRERLKRERRLSIAAAARIVIDVCDALERAHALGIVHRDLKPANVFLARVGGEEVVKVLDFGIAKLQGDGTNLTATGEMIGTPQFMSPELIQAAKHVDHRADLWALAVIAFRAITGVLPFKGQTLEIVQKVVSSSAPVPSSVAPDLPAAVDAFFARALARDIAHRFQSARELSAAIGQLAGVAPTTSLPDTGPPSVGSEAGTIVLANPGTNAPHGAAGPVPSEGDQRTVVMSPEERRGKAPAPTPSSPTGAGPLVMTPMAPAPQAMAPAYQGSMPVAQAPYGIQPVSPPIPPALASVPDQGRSWVLWVVLGAAVVALFAVLAIVLLLVA